MVGVPVWESIRRLVRRRGRFLIISAFYRRGRCEGSPRVLADDSPSVGVVTSPTVCLTWNDLVDAGIADQDSNKVIFVFPFAGIILLNTPHWEFGALCSVLMGGSSKLLLCLGFEDYLCMFPQ